MDSPQRAMIVSDLMKARNYINAIKQSLPLLLEGECAAQLDDLESAMELLLDAYKKIIAKTNVDPNQWEKLFERVKQFRKDLTNFEFFDDVILPAGEDEDSIPTETIVAPAPTEEIEAPAEVFATNGKPKAKPRRKKS